MWRLDTADGSWAVKVPLHPSSEEEASAGTSFQEAAYAAGVPTPQVRRTTDGRIFATIAGTQVRVYGWVDLLAPDTKLDPDLVGAVVAAIHRVRISDPSPLDPWYHEPIGADRWDQLVEQLRDAGAPFAGRLAALRDELVALESWIEPPQADPDLSPRPVGRQRPAHRGRRRVRHRLGEQRPCRSEPGARVRPVRVRPHRRRAASRALADAYRRAGGPAMVNERGHFSMLIAQLGHINEIAATDWLTPNPRSPQRSDSEAWISETLDDPHTRELLDTILAAARPPLASCRLVAVTMAVLFEPDPLRSACAATLSCGARCASTSQGPASRPRLTRRSR